MAEPDPSNLVWYDLKLFNLMSDDNNNKKKTKKKKPTLSENYSYCKVCLPTQNQSYWSCYLICKIAVASKFNCATLLNLGAPLAKSPFHVARKNSAFLNSFRCKHG